MPLVDLNGLGYFKGKENAMVAGNYSAASTYAVGDYVYYNGTLYRCTTAIATAEAWTSGHWTAAKVGEDIASLKNALTEQTENIFSESNLPIEIDKIAGITKHSGFVGGVPTSGGRIGIKLTVNSSYDSYAIVLSEPTEIYFDSPTVNYLSLCVAYNFTSTDTDSGGNIYYLGENSIRYRKSDNNLPTQENPLSLPTGTAVVFTVTANQTENVYGFNVSYDAINPTFAEKVAEITNKKPIIKYSATVDTDIGSRGKEQITIFLPTYNGYIKYAIVRCEYDEYNANNWRIDKCYYCNSNKVVQFPITNSGEWEMAIHIADAPDFIGGNAHGDEVLVAFNVLINGTDVGTVSNIVEQEFETVRIVETTLLYNPNDGATLSTRSQFTPIGTHGREYIIDKNGIRLTQEVTLDVALTLDASYMTMLPIIRGNDAVSEEQITDHYYADNNYTIYDVSTGGSGDGYGWKFNVSRATIWGEESGVSATVEMLKQPDIDNEGARRFQVQSTVDAYNKLYWSICGVNNHPYDASANERFVTDTLYNISVKNS